MSDNEDYFSDVDSVVSSSDEDENDEILNVTNKNNEINNSKKIKDLILKNINDDNNEDFDDYDDEEPDDVDEGSGDDYDYDNDESQQGGDIEESLSKKSTINKTNINDDEDDDEDDDDSVDNYLQKFDSELNNNYIENYHPECSIQNYDEILTLTKVVRDKNNNIIDPFHKTIPFLTKYEKTRIIGQRAKQINSGAKPFIKVPENVIDGYLIAELELQQKRIPFIIRRPLNNGGSEYWNLKDLEIVNF